MAISIKGVNTGVIRKSNNFIALALKIKEPRNKESLFFMSVMELRDLLIERGRVRPGCLRLLELGVQLGNLRAKLSLVRVILGLGDVCSISHIGELDALCSGHLLGKLAEKLLTENGLEVIIVRGIRHLLFLLFLVIRFDFWTGCLPLGGARETRAPGKTKERSPKRIALMVMDYLTLGSPASSSICTVSETN